MQGGAGSDGGRDERACFWGRAADLIYGRNPRFTWSAERALQAMVEYQVESLRFIARRTYCNLEFMRHLRHCAGWQEIAQVQQSWFKECVADYGEKLGRLADAGFQLARSDLTPLQWLMYRQARGGKSGNDAGG